MNVDQDIQSYKIIHLLNYVYWIYLFKSIQDKFIPLKTHDLKDKYYCDVAVV